MSALVVDILDLPRETGAIKDVHLEVPAPADLGTGIIGVPEGSPMLVDVQLTSLDDGVLARGRAQVHIHGECVRCLLDLDEDRTVSFDELYVLPDVARAQVEEGDDEADELFLLGDTSVDLELALRDALVPTLPFRPLCSPDCAGLCTQCGQRLADLPSGHSHEQLDPRWSALAGLLPTQEEKQD